MKGASCSVGDACTLAEPPLRISYWLLSAVAVLTACQAPRNEERDAPRDAPRVGAARSAMFFENAVRRDATTEEATRVAYLGGCTAFFLENTAGKHLLASAEHCFEFDPVTWCRTQGGLADNFGATGYCRRVSIADPNHDILIFEADIAHATTGPTTLRLASYVPTPGANLAMTGYPLDEDPETARRGVLTTTDHCWTLTPAIDSPYKDYDIRTLDKSAQHNCSTYGGNSGGPMVRQGTRDAVGLPFTYAPDDYTRRSATDLTTAAYLALTADFVATHRSELAAFGVAIADKEEGGTNVNTKKEDPPPPPAKDPDPPPPARDAGTPPAEPEGDPAEPTPPSATPRGATTPEPTENGGCSASGATPMSASASGWWPLAALLLFRGLRGARGLRGPRRPRRVRTTTRAA